jgi:hypothetical protein
MFEPLGAGGLQNVGEKAYKNQGVLTEGIFIADTSLNHVPSMT